MDERALSRCRPWKIATALIGSALLLASCGSGEADGGAGRGGPGGPTQVGFIVVEPGSAPIQQQLSGRVAAYQVSEVRPQVSGVITRRMFREGSVVKQGQTLYQIDPSLFQPRPHYLLKVKGMSMRNAGILDGDLVAVHRTPEVRNRQIVVARLENEVTVKRYRQDGSIAWLLPENEEFEPMRIDLREQSLTIEGVVVGVVRQTH